MEGGRGRKLRGEEGERKKCKRGGRGNGDEGERTEWGEENGGAEGGRRRKMEGKTESGENRGEKRNWRSGEKWRARAGIGISENLEIGISEKSGNYSAP
jgi:hypothetical protein